MSDALELTLALIRRASVSPQDEGCLDLIGSRLMAIGFDNERLDFGPVANLWSWRCGHEERARGDGDRGRALRRAAPGAPRYARLSADQRRGRPFDRRHAARHRDARESRRTHRLV